MIRYNTGHILTVDLTNKTAWITEPNGTTIAAWSNVTRRTGLAAAHLDGWHTTTDWDLTSPPDGFYRGVTRADGENACDICHQENGHSPVCPRRHS